MSTPSSVVARRAPKDLVVGLLLLALAAGGVAWLALRSPVPPARPAASDVLLEGTFPLEGGGLSRRVRVKEAARLEIRVDAPPGETLRCAFGPPGPVEAAPIDLPDPSRTARWEVTAGAPPHVETVLAYGLYVLRVDRVLGADSHLRPDSAAAPSARVVVRALPVR